MRGDEVRQIIEPSSLKFSEARAEFQKAHASAKVRGAFDWLLRRCGSLCTLDDAAAYLAATRRPMTVDAASNVNGHATDTPTRPSLMPSPAQLREVPLGQIVGSLDRAEDYTADFLPRIASDEERWARVRVAIDSLVGVPPVQLLEVDGDYYVKDGHHRVSVMKRLKLRTVEAYVTRLVPVE